jgi:PPE-repeat protein
MSFTAVIPEVIAAQIVAGDQGATLTTASMALTALAAQLSDTAAIWTSTFAGLTAQAGWQGAGAAAALAAADQYINWLTTTQAEVEAAQTAVAESLVAYEAARTGIVNVATVAANRTALTAALAAMPFSAATVATLEAEYAAFAATDLTVINAYQATDAAALPALTAPPLDVTGAVLPITAPAADAATAAAAPALTLGSGDIINSLDGLIGTPAVANSVNGAVNTAAWFVGNTIPTAVSLGHTLAGATVPALAVGDVVPDGAAAGVMEGTVVGSVSPMAGVGSWAGMGASAGVGEATTVGKLSVPATWAGATQAEATLASSTAPLGGSGWTVAAEEAGAGGMGAPGMPGMVGGAGAKGAGAFAGPRYGTKPIVMPKSVVV